VSNRPSFSLRARARSFRYAARGIGTLFRFQHNAWIHAVATAAVLSTGFVVGFSRLEWCVVVAAIMAVWTAEALNTAFEALCDVASPALHPAVERAKDVAAGGVLITSMRAAIIGMLILASHAMNHSTGQTRRVAPTLREPVDSIRRGSEPKTPSDAGGTIPGEEHLGRHEAEHPPSSVDQLGRGDANNGAQAGIAQPVLVVVEARSSFGHLG